MSDANTRNNVWTDLRDAGLVTGDCPGVPDRSSPWYVRTMLGVAGWIGALFLLGFVGAGLEFVFKSGVAGLLVGGLCCGGAYFIFHSLPRNDLATQAGLATSLAGQVMFIFGLHETLGSDGTSPAFLLVVAIFEGVLALLLANFVHRVWSAMAASIAFIFAMNLLGLFGFGPGFVAAAVAVLWIDEHRFASNGGLWRAIGYGLTFALLLPRTAFLWEIFARSQSPVLNLPWTRWVASFLFPVVLVFVVNKLLVRYGASPSGKTGMAVRLAAVAVAIASFNAPGISSALIVLLLGFACGNRVLLGVGMAGLLGYLSYFYYLMQSTLLTKSLVLMGTGAVLVVLWTVMRVLFAEDTAPEEARA